MKNIPSDDNNEDSIVFNIKKNTLFYVILSRARMLSINDRACEETFYCKNVEEVINARQRRFLSHNLSSTVLTDLTKAAATTERIDSVNVVVRIQTLSGINL